MNRSETKQVLIGLGIDPARLPDNGPFDLSGAYLNGANLSRADLNETMINWQSHALIAELLKRWAGADVERRKVAGLIAISTDWCWDKFLELNHDPLFLPAIRHLSQFVKDDDKAPEILRSQK